MVYNRRTMERIVYVAPAVIVLFFLIVYPMSYSLYLSFFYVEGWAIAKAPFVGLLNYARVLSDPIFLRSLGFTCLYTFLVIIIELFMGILLAYSVNELAKSNHRAHKPIAVLILLPILFPPVAVAQIASLMLNDLIGLIPHLIVLLLNVRIPLLSERWPATGILVAIDVWQWSSFFFLLIYAGFRMLPRSAVEGAQIDGATGWQVLRYVILPMIRYTVLIALVLRGIWVFRSFDIPRLVTRGGPGTATRTITMQIFEYSFKEGLLGVGAASTWIVFIFINVAVLCYFRYVIRRT